MRVHTDGAVRRADTLTESDVAKPGRTTQTKRSSLAGPGFLDNATRRRYPTPRHVGEPIPGSPVGLRAPGGDSMRPEEVVRLLESVGAIRQGHFELSSGLHSGTYVQCAVALQHPRYAEQLGRALAAEFHDLRVDCVASPAIGGIVLGHEVARATPARPDGTMARAIFVERDARGLMVLRRGFEVGADEHVLVVEDVWTTGGSTYETIRVIEQAAGRVVAAGALIDRSGGRLEFPVRAEALVDLKIENYDAADCPLCRAGSAVTRPGSRFLGAMP